MDSTVVTCNAYKEVRSQHLLQHPHIISQPPFTDGFEGQGLQVGPGERLNRDSNTRCQGDHAMIFKNMIFNDHVIFQGDPLPAAPVPATPDHQLAPFRELLQSLCGKVRQGVSPEADLPPHTMEAVDRMSGTELREHLLAIDPLDHLWVARVNQVWEIPPLHDTPSPPTNHLPVPCAAPVSGSRQAGELTEMPESIGMRCS